MSKRPRRSTSKTRSSKRPAMNPFLKFSGQKVHNRDEGDDAVFNSFLSFMQLTKQKGHDSKKTEVDTAVHLLLSGLNSEENQQSKRTLLSASDIVAVLLPWATKSILHSSMDLSDSETQWFALERCLQHMIESSKKTGSSFDSSMLTLSVLHKLVPLAGNLAFEKRSLRAPAIVKSAAKCYCLLVDEFYLAAPFDVVCDSLLRILAEDGKVKSIPPEDQELQIVVVSSLRLLLRRLKQANPKKSFQQLTKRSVFAILAGIIQQQEGWVEDPLPIIKDLLLHGLFDLKNHMEGFRSIKMEIPTINKMPDKMDVDKEEEDGNNKPSFHCYQEGLFSMLDNLFSSKHGKVTNEASSTIQLLPLLLEAFIEQTFALQKQIGDYTSSRKRASDGVKIMQLQFRFFAFLSACLFRIVHSVDDEGNDLRVTVFSAIETNLNLVLKHDVYLPTNEDKEELHFNFLLHLGQSLIAKVKDTEVSSTGIAAEEWRHSLSILSSFVQLNHLLLHPQLAEYIAFCVRSWDASDLKSCPEATNLVCTVVKTYRKLRQFDYFCLSYIQAVDLLRANDDTGGLQGLKNLIAESEVRTQLSEAVSSSPVNQLKQVFSKINTWLVEVSAQLDKQSNYLSVSCVVGVLIILMQNVRVDMNTATEIYPHCEEIMVGALRSLVKTSKVYGLRLCGWTVALQNKCEFWMGSGIENVESETQWFQMPNDLLQILNETAASKSMDEATIRELQFLACQRIQRLHREVQENQRLLFASTEPEQSSDAQVSEATKLARFALQAAISKSKEEIWSGDVSRIDVLIESIASWSAYVDEEYMFSFLSVLFLGTAIKQSQTLGTASSLPLLQDAEFLETPNVAATLGAALMSCTAELTQRALGSSIASEVVKPAAVFIPVRHPSRKRLTPKLLVQMLASGIQNTNYVQNEQTYEKTAFIESALVCLNMLRNVRASLWVDTQQGIDVFDSAIRLDGVFRSLIDDQREVRSSALAVLVSLREVMAQIVEDLQEIQVVLLSDKLVFRKLVEYFPKTTIVLMDRFPNDDVAHGKLRKSCRRIVGSLTMFASRHTALLEEYKNGMFTVFRTPKSPFSDHHMQLLFSLASHISNKVTKSMDKLMANVIDHIQGTLWKHALVIAFGTKSEQLTLRNSASLLVASLLKHASIDTRNGWLTAEVRENLEELITEKAKVVLLENPSHSELHSTSYLIGCLALIDPANATRSNLINSILKVVGRTNDPVLENAFCRLAQGLDTGSFEDVLRSLLSIDAWGEEVPYRLRLFRLLVLNSSDKVPEIAKFSRRFFFLSVQSFVQEKSFPEVRSSQFLRSGVDLIIDMASNKDIISLRERDMALILSHVNSALNVNGRCDCPDFVPVPIAAFHLCFDMLSFLLQRFPKQLYSCVSLTTNAITTLFRHALYGDLPASDMKSRCQKFTRICELLLPHGEVYKKHVLSLIFEFVDALRGDMDPTRKVCLSPAVYCLLDILQQHEITQLNSMLDDMGRTLLRSVHKTYQKLHVYKGQ
eukprot:scaffold1384_cov116-Cylindrotheca_fusiformis.AAC.7